MLCVKAISLRALSNLAVVDFLLFLEELVGFHLYWRGVHGASSIQACGQGTASLFLELSGPKVTWTSFGSPAFPSNLGSVAHLHN